MSFLTPKTSYQQSAKINEYVKKSISRLVERMDGRMNGCHGRDPFTLYTHNSIQSFLNMYKFVHIHNNNSNNGCLHFKVLAEQGTTKSRHIPAYYLRGLYHRILISITSVY